MANFELLVLSSPYSHHYLSVEVPDEVTHTTHTLQWIAKWLSNTEYAGCRILRIIDTDIIKPDVTVL